MPKSTNRRKINKQVNLPKPQQSPEAEKALLNGKTVAEQGLSFSFVCLDRLDRRNSLFNLGDVPVEWFISLLDCLKEISNMPFKEFQFSKTHDPHRVDWKHTNASAPDEQHEYWQFRLNKSKGRVIGFNTI